MSSTFFRLNTDHTATPVPLENLFAGPTATACWLIGGGPSLAMLPTERIAASPVPRMSINLAGTKLLRPNFWTSYDPSVRFHGSIYLDAGITKFVHRRRAMDLVPGTGFKVCESPNLYFFDRDGDRGFADLLTPSSPVISLSQAGEQKPLPIVDWADSMVQAIDILYRLGFRILYLAGCEMLISPSEEQRRLGREKNVEYQPGEPLGDFIRRCEKARIPAKELERAGSGPQYHFDEEKPLRAAINTDLHYFRIVQYLRLSRRSLALAGMQLVSVTPSSRLNDWFPYRPVEDVLTSIQTEVGDPATEPTRGLYTQSDSNPRPFLPLGPMRDFRPPRWDPERPPKRIEQAGRTPPCTTTPIEIRPTGAEFIPPSQLPLKQKLQHLREKVISHDEEG